MNDFIFDNINNSSLMSEHSEQIKQSQDKFVDIDNKETKDLQNENEILVKYNCSSETLKNSSNSSSEIDGVTVSSGNIIRNLKDSNEFLNNENDGEINSTNNSDKSVNVQRFRTIIDSDTEEEEFTALVLNKSKLINTNCEKKKLSDKSKSKLSRLRFDSDSDDNIDELIGDNNSDNEQSNNDNEPIIKAKSNKFSDLIDSESENENDNRNKNNLSSDEFNKYNSDNEESKKKSKTKIGKIKRSGTKRAAKDKAMREIHSETQRLIREAPVSLPYHRPKQRSLQEFLNRKKIVPIIRQGSTTAAKLKMCTEIVNKVVKEKEKEAELFFKSSDSEEENEIPISIKSKNHQINPILSQNSTLDIPIEDTQKFHKNNIQNANNKKQIIQQGNLELGVPRKLFLDDVKDPIEIESIDTPMIDQQLDDNQVKKQTKVCREDLKEVAVPRKLFNNNFEDYTGGSFERCDTFTSDSTSTVDNNPVDNQKIEEIQLSNDNSIDNTNNDENNSTENKTPEIIAISSSKSFENSQDSLKLIPNDKIIDLTATQSISASSESNLPSDNCEIYDTPLINKKEIQKLNGRNLNYEKSSGISNVISTDDTSQSSEPDCGVVGLPPPIFDSDKEIIESPQTTAVTVKKSALINVPKLKPKLRGAPGTFIDLTQDVKPNKEAVNNLVDRFISKHSVTNKHNELNSEVTVVQAEATADGFKISKDILPYKSPVTIESVDDTDLNKPGAKLLRLREELQKKMTNKRNEEWKQREKELMLDEEEIDNDEEVDEFEPEDKDKKSVVDLETSDLEESEPEENDILIKNKKRLTCAFGDEEAEIDEDEDMDLSDDEDEEDEADDDDDENEEESDEEDKSDKINNQMENAQEKRKKFNRIVTEDDNSNSGDATDIDDTKISVRLERKRTDIDMFDDNEDELEVSQKIISESQSSSVFKTPLTPNFLPDSLESRTRQLNSFGIKLPNSNLNSQTNNFNSQLNNWQSQSDNEEIKNNLYNVQDRHVTDEELMAVCSGRFTDSDSNTQNDNQPRLMNLIDSSSDEQPITESQIVGICSGTFFSSPLLSATDLSDNVNETPQDNIRLTLDNLSQNSNDNILKKNEKNEKVNTKIQSFLDIASSSDDEIDNKMNNDNKKKILKKKKVKQLILSDDEDDEINENNCRDNDDEEEEDDEEAVESDEDEEKFIDYDSEENEVVVVNRRDLRKVAENFVDAEAELSESEWGSEDEDEHGMDKLEVEEGDGEEIDEDQMRAQLGKLHARQVLDDDQRDVRMLKEMLFEDGDLHTDGAGRERRFKWRNIDKLGNENLLLPTNNDVDDENQLDPLELANELEWRKLRMEREKFLEEKMKSDAVLNPLDNDLDDVIESGDKFLKLGMKVLKKCRTSFEIKTSNVETTRPIVPRTVSELIGASDGKTQILHNAMKRGSFLARGDKALARLAVMIDKSDTVQLAPKYSKNFLFTHISPSVTDRDDEDDENILENKTVRNEENNDKPIRKRKPTSGGTPRTAKKPKIDVNRSGKKLF